MEYTLVVNERDVQVLAAALGKVELGFGLDTFNKINNQIQEQLKGDETSE